MLLQFGLLLVVCVVGGGLALSWLRQPRAGSTPPVSEHTGRVTHHLKGLGDLVLTVHRFKGNRSSGFGTLSALLNGEKLRLRAGSGVPFSLVGRLAGTLEVPSPGHLLRAGLAGCQATDFGVVDIRLSHVAQSGGVSLDCDYILKLDSLSGSMQVSYLGD